MNKHSVAYLDILGFKNLIKEHGALKVGETYKRINEAYQEIINSEKAARLLSDKEEFCYKYIFSDTVILVSKDETQKSFEQLIHAAKRILQVLNGHKLFTRGSITFGEMYVNCENNLFLGEPLIKAYNLEKQQEWIGVIIDKSLEDNFPDLFSIENRFNPLKQVLVKYNVPFKCSHEYLYFTLNWLDQIGGTIHTIIDRVDLSTIPFNDRIKYTNTQKYIKYIHSVWNINCKSGEYEVYNKTNDKYSHLKRDELECFVEKII